MKIRFFIVLIFSILGVVACGDAATPTPVADQSSETNTPVRVIAKDFVFEPSVDSVPAGEVTFTLVNQGTQEHEMVVLRTDLPADSLPMSATEPDDVDEDAAGAGPGEVPETAVGATGEVTINLTPGRYLLLCNIPGHYAAGMVTEFRVY